MAVRAVLAEPNPAPRPDPGGPSAVSGHHLPALNGLRAMAVIAVVAYHLEAPWARGGYLGVDLFFVLSGFLITSLLLEEWVRTTAVNLAAFWGRRAKRLLPALFLVVAALGVYLVLNARFGGPGANGTVDLSGLRGDALATLVYVSNWHAIFTHQSYFAQFQVPSPLAHTWSLAIEEQFYLVWPPVLLLLFFVARGAWRSVGLVVAVVATLASAALMAVLFVRGVDADPSTTAPTPRAFDLMAGAAVAFIAAARPQPGPRTAPGLARRVPTGRRRVGGGVDCGGDPERVSLTLYVRRWLRAVRGVGRRGGGRRPALRSGPILPCPLDRALAPRWG